MPGLERSDEVLRLQARAMETPRPKGIVMMGIFAYQRFTIVAKYLLWALGLCGTTGYHLRV